MADLTLEVLREGMQRMREQHTEELVVPVNREVYETMRRVEAWWHEHDNAPWPKRLWMRALAWVRISPVGGRTPRRKGWHLWR